MRKVECWMKAGLVLVALCVGAIGAAQAQETYFSPIDVAASPDGKTLYVAEYTANQVAVVDAAAGTVAKTIAVPEPPAGLALSPDGARLFVAGGAPAGHVHVVNLADGALETLPPVGHTLISPTISPDGAKLYVAARFNNAILVVDLASKAEVARIAVTREPYALALTPDGKTLVVANHLLSQASDQDYVAAKVDLIDTATNAVAASIQLPNGCTGVRGACVSPDGQFAYIVHILGRYQLPTTQLERGWMNTNAMSIISVPEQKLVNTVLLDDVDLGAANPWDVTCTADGALLCVSHAGTQELSVINRAAMHEKINKVAAGEKVSEVSLTPEDVPNDLSFLVGLRKRIKLTGNGARGLAVVGTNAYVAEYFTDTIGVVDFNPEGVPRPKSIALGPDKPLSVVRKGEMFFNDADLCFQHWQSCASCHPDGRADGLNWDLLNDGIGNPKNTKSMLLAIQTPPAMISGVRDRGETAVRSGIKFIQFAVRPEEDALAIDEYFKSLTPVLSPYLVNGQLSEAANRGRAVFEKAGCATCHPAPLYTSLQTFNVGTGKDREKDFEWDTPTLIETWRTAPYLHDGRSVSLKDVITKDNPENKHGNTSGLTEQEINDLNEFLLSL